MKILVCGGRNYHNQQKVFEVLDQYCLNNGLCIEHEDGNWLPANVIIIHGDANGADQLADQWAVVNWVPIEVYPADWEHQGKKAGILRNIDMLELGQPDLVIAFPGGVGTQHMKTIARKKGVRVWEID